MDGLLFLVLVAGVGSLVLYLSLQERRAADVAWADGAALLGLEVTGGVGERSIIGRVGECLVQVSEIKRGKSLVTRFVVRHREIPEGLKLKAEGGLTELKKVFTGEDILLGDQAFDDLVNVSGSEDAALAALDEDARRGLGVLLGTYPGARIAGCSIELELPTVVRDAGLIVAVTQAMIKSADALRVKSIPGALLQNLKTDRSAATRRRNLEVLLGEYGGTVMAQEAAEAALKDESPAVRLMGAARVRDDRGLHVLAALAFDDTVGAEVRAEALEHLASGFPYEKIATTVAKAIQSDDQRVVRAAVAVAGAGRDAAVLKRVCEIASLSRVGTTVTESLAETCATSLGLIGGPAAQSTLLTLLEHESEKVRRAAASGLGKIGTVEAVEPLMALTGGVLGGAVKEAARDSIRLIQNRLGDAEGGRLSVAAVDGAAAGLSLVDDGGLSVAGEAPDPRPKRIKE